MSESEEEDFKEQEADSAAEDDGEDEKTVKSRLTFAQFDDLGLLLSAAGGDEDLCLSCIHRLGSVPGVKAFSDIRKLAASIAELVPVLSLNKASSSSSSIAETPKKAALKGSSDMVLLNLLYAPRRSRLFSLMKTLSRIENASYICAWTKIPPSQVSYFLIFH